MDFVSYSDLKTNPQTIREEEEEGKLKRRTQARYPAADDEEEEEDVKEEIALNIWTLCTYDL